MQLFRKLTSSNLNNKSSRGSVNSNTEGKRGSANSNIAEIEREPSNLNITEKAERESTSSNISETKSEPTNFNLNEYENAIIMLRTLKMLCQELQALEKKGVKTNNPNDQIVYKVSENSKGFEVYLDETDEPLYSYELNDVTKKINLSVSGIVGIESLPVKSAFRSLQRDYLTAFASMFITLVRAQPSFSREHWSNNTYARLNYREEISLVRYCFFEKNRGNELEIVIKDLKHPGQKPIRFISDNHQLKRKHQLKIKNLPAEILHEKGFINAKTSEFLMGILKENNELGANLRKQSTSICEEEIKDERITTIFRKNSN